MESRVTGLTDRATLLGTQKSRLDVRKKNPGSSESQGGAEDSSYFRGRLAFQLFFSGLSNLLIPDEENIICIPKMRQYVLNAFLKADRGSKFFSTRSLGHVGNSCRRAAVKNS